MANKYSPSVNILRDAGRQLNYIMTPNAVRIADQIMRDYDKGIHSFTIIGSYGTGKSSFLMAFDRSIKGENIFKFGKRKAKKIESIQVVGQYQSLIKYFHELFDIADDFDGNQKIFDKLYELSESCDQLVIYLDEFGKFLEYASKFNAEKELYFIQQFAEFVNNHDREILLISTLHQSFEAYAGQIVEEIQKKEWTKVKGRFKELTFNEPVEQLLFLAAERLKGDGKLGESHFDLAKRKHILPFSSDAVKSIESSLAPLDIISAAILTKALQQYGQNERSLFTFLESDLKDEKWTHVATIYDYLLSSFYASINSGYNLQYRAWQAYQAGIERIESDLSANIEASLAVFKTIALTQLFAAKSAHVDDELLITYFKHIYPEANIKTALVQMEKMRIIRFTKFNNSYKIIEGTDVDFDLELLKADEAVDRTIDILPVLEEHFNFPVLQAKEVSYQKGTPRLFRFIFSNHVRADINPEGAFDGYVNLIFNDRLKVAEIKEKSFAQEEAVLYGYFTNSKSIRDHIHEILKTKKVLADNQDDRVARREFQKILESHERLLSHEVLGSLYTEKVKWYFKGQEQKNIHNQKKFNSVLSRICANVYQKAPIFNNELLNKHKISTSIHTARKNYFKALAENWNTEDLGFEKDKFPPEKTIYKSILQKNGMHRLIDGLWELAQPKPDYGFHEIWNVCQEFLKDARQEERKISELWNLLSERPYKLKLGLIDFWVPTFLFINRGDFALYEDGRFVPYLNESVLYLMTRQPESYTVKAFEISGLRLKVFNKYREFLQQSSKNKLSQEGFIESVRPFLVFYKSLNDYSKSTSRMSNEALELRKAIIDAQDPEKTFFESIPNAMKMDILSIESSDKYLAEFAVKLNESIDEIKNAYFELLNRFEYFICLEIFGKKFEFQEYKKAFVKRYKGIKEHRLLPKQKIFVARLHSPLNDRDSWLASIAQSILSKPLDKISDGEEEVLKDRLHHICQELDNIQVLHQMKLEDGEQVYKVDFTSIDGMKSSNVRIPKDKVKEVNAKSLEIEKLLGKNQNLRLAVLSQLLKKEIGNE